MAGTRKLARIVAVVALLVALASCAVWYLFPDLPGAVLTRLRYSNEGRLVDSTQYRHTVPITSSTDRNRSRPNPAVAATVPAEAAQALVEFAEETTSNIVIATGEGEILVETYHATPEADAMMLTNSMSMAKTLVGMLVGVAIDKGVIQSVDEPIGKFLKEFEADPRGKITIRNLLQMESGLASQDAGFPLTHLQAMYFGDSPHRRALSVPAVERPGVSYDYNSVNTQLLLIIVERAMGDDFESLLSRFVWQPLALDDGFGWRATKAGDAKGFCCVFATARAWAAIGGVLLDAAAPDERDSRIVSRSWLRDMMTPAASVPNYGYQIFLGKTKSGEVPFATMVGTPQQLVVVFPTLGLTAVRVGNEHPQFSGQRFHSVVMRIAAGIGRRPPGME
jgi:CubicO group peptidase (beta-lactamase class C family)